MYVIDPVDLEQSTALAFSCIKNAKNKRIFAISSSR